MPLVAAAKKSVVLGMYLEPPHLDITAGAAAAIREVAHLNIFEGLTRMDENGEIKPLLAKSWRKSANGKTYTFYLRAGVKFHNGVAFDCQVVQFSYWRALSDNSVNAQKRLFSDIDTIRCPKSLKVVITLKTANINFPAHLAWGDAVMVEPSSVVNNKTQPVGTGPYRFKRWLRGDRIELTRNAQYWGKKPPMVDGTFRFIGDPAAATTAMLSGDIDGFSNLPAPESVPVLQANSKLRVVVGTTEGKTILALNNSHPRLNDIRVRRALAYAIDQISIIDSILYSFGRLISSHMTSNNKYYINLNERYAYDPDKAKALLIEAQATDLRFTLKLPPPAYARRSGQVIAAQLAEVGVQVDIEPIEWAQWLDQVFRKSDFDMTIISHVEPDDIEIYAREQYYFNYGNRDVFRKMYQRYLRSKTFSASKKHMIAMQKKLSDDAVNVFLFQLPKIGVWKSSLHGMAENTKLPLNELARLSWR